jgi:DNA polymerase V
MANLMNVVSVQPFSPSDHRLPVLAGTAAGGFPTPAADFYEPPISLDELLNIRAPHVWVVQLEGDSMSGAGLYDGSRLIVDRSIEACSGHIVLAYVDNQPLVKRLSKSADGWRLLSENPNYKPVAPSEYESIEIFGVVTWCLTPHAL